MMVGGGQGQRGIGGGNLPPSDGPGGGGPGGGIQGVARDLSITLSADRSTLTLALTPNDDSLFTTGVTYSIFWLPPSIFSQNDVYGQTQAGITGNGISLIQGRQKVTDVQGGAGIVSASVPYVPYVSGGWMYAVVLPAGGSREYRLNGTNFVPVPPLDAAGGPLDSEKPIKPYIIIDSTPGGNNRRCAFGWNNGSTLTSVAYVAIVAKNYMFDGFYRQVALFKVNTAPGARQGVAEGVGGAAASFQADMSQNVILEIDSGMGAHTINWYFVPLTPAFVPLALNACNFINTGAIS